MGGEQAGRGLGRVMGVVSLALGIPQAAMPERMARKIGVVPTTGSTALVRAAGLHELTVGAAILARRRPTGWLWTRVAGDGLHLGLLRSALRAGDSDPGRVRAAIRVVAAIGALDLVAALAMARSRRAPLRTVATVTVNRPPQEVYRVWRDFPGLARFMAHLESVEATGQGRWRWEARAPGGRRVSWDAEVVEDRPGQVLSWRSVDGDVPNAGSVSFAPAPGDRGTEVTVELTYAPPGGRAGAFAAALLGEAPRQQVADDLRRFKQVVETGEVLRSDAIPEGVISKRQARQLAAQPTRTNP